LNSFGAFARHGQWIIEALAHFDPGKVYAATGKRDEAVNEHQEFLSHFENFGCTFDQIDQARAVLQRSLL
jgi:hypothetical protein